MLWAKLLHRLAATFETAVIAGAIDNDFHLGAAGCAGQDLALGRDDSMIIDLHHRLSATANAAIPAIAGYDLFYYRFTFFALKISHFLSSFSILV